MDNVGFAVVVPGTFMDLRLLPELLAAAPLPVTSQLRISFSMALNVLLSHTPAQVRTLLDHSFAAHLLRQAGSSPKRLWRAFKRHLRFLQERGYVSEEGALTERGRWAAKLRIDQPLTIAECLGESLLPESDPILLAGLIAGLVFDRDDDAGSDTVAIPRRLDGALTRIHRGLRPYALHAQRCGFEVRPLSLRAAITMYGWAEGQSWSKVVSASGLADGDVVMLASRTADHLRHVAGLREAFPAIARTARRAVEALMREPVT
jgi:superfamily II RNA helicase